MDRPILSEERLMALAAAGDQPAFQGLVRRLGSAMLTLAYKLTGNQTAAEEVFVDAVARVWVRRSTYKPGHAVRPWLMTIVANTYRERRRKQRPWARSAAMVANPPSDSERRADDETGVVKRISAALDQLPARQREVLVLRIWGGLGYAEIGCALGITGGTARSNMHHALAALRRTLGDLHDQPCRHDTARPRPAQNVREQP